MQVVVVVVPGAEPDELDSTVVHVVTSVSVTQEETDEEDDLDVERFLGSPWVFWGESRFRVIRVGVSG